MLGAFPNHRAVCGKGGKKKKIELGHNQSIVVVVGRVVRSIGATPAYIIAYRKKRKNR